MSTLFSQLQQLVTKTGTFVIECRSMETKCDDALIALDIEADMDVNIEFTRKVGGGSGGSSTVIVGPMAVMAKMMPTW